MSKVLHKKLINHNPLTAPQHSSFNKDLFKSSSLRLEFRVLEEAMKDLLCPRQEAVNRILELSRLV